MNWRVGAAIAAALLIGISVVLTIALSEPAPPGHQVFINGTVITLDEDGRIVEALSVREGVIDAAGSTADIMAGVDQNTEIVDLRGRTLLPGFIDAHGHFPGSALDLVAADLSSPPVGTVRNIEDLLQVLQQRVAITPAGEWVMGFGYDDTLLAEGRHPDRAELDALSVEHPIALLHVSGHMVMANSLALATVGITAETPDPPGGVIVREAGEPSGLLEETARLEMLRQAMDFGLAAALKMAGAASKAYAAAGVTTAQMGAADPLSMQGMKWFSRLGVITQRLVMFPMAEAWGDDLLNGVYQPQDFAGERIMPAAVKLIADGSIQGFTGYLRQPYHTPYHGDAEHRGYLAIPREELFEQVATLHGAGYQLAIHGNGDAAIDAILDAFEAAQQRAPVADPRLILIHAQMLQADQLARMQELGVTPSFFAAHSWYWGDRHRDIFLGPERAATISPARWAVDAGLRFSTHLDTPVVPMNPLQSVWSAVNRGTVDGDTLGPAQRISVQQALRSITIDAAWQVFQDHRIGSLQAGKLADLVILSGNPLEQPETLRELVVERTVVGGVTVYRKQR